MTEGCIWWNFSFFLFLTCLLSASTIFSYYFIAPTLTCLHSLFLHISFLSVVAPFISIFGAYFLVPFYMAVNSKLSQVVTLAIQRCCILLFSSLAWWMFCKCQTMFSFFCQKLSTALSLPSIYHLYVSWALKKKKATHSTIWIPFFFLFCLPQSPFTLIINIVSNYLSWWQALRYSSMVKNQRKKYSFFYTHQLSLFIQIPQILSSEQASSFIICQP